MSAGCRRSSGRFRQCQRGADARLEGFDNVNGVRTLVGKVSTMSAGCGRSSGRFRQCQRVADARREGFDNVTGC
jgi:hypothetical protein